MLCVDFSLSLRWTELSIVNGSNLWESCSQYTIDSHKLVTIPECVSNSLPTYIFVRVYRSLVVGRPINFGSQFVLVNSIFILHSMRYIILLFFFSLEISLLSGNLHFCSIKFMQFSFQVKVIFWIIGCVIVSIQNSIHQMLWIIVINGKYIYVT